MASLVGLILMLLTSCVVSPCSHTPILIPCCTDCRMKGLIKCPALHFQLRAAHAHRRWQNDRHDHSTSSHKQFWAQVLHLLETLEDKKYSKTKRGHSKQSKTKEKIVISHIKPKLRRLKCTDLHRAVHSLK